jgi:lipoate-protein ligase A
VQHDAAAEGVRHMAVDLALLDRAARTGVATLRTYAWTRETVSFGRHETVAAAWDVAAMQAAGLDVVRRPTGGRALLHGADLTYAVALPVPHTVGWRAAYAAVNVRLLAALRALGVAATLVDDGAAVPPDGLACFGAPAPGEIAVAGRKLVGSAVWRTPTAYLQHGSILLRDTQARLNAFRYGDALATPAGTSLSDLVPVPAQSGQGDLAARCRRDVPRPDESLDLWRQRGRSALEDAFGAAPDARPSAMPDRRDEDDRVTLDVARHHAVLDAPAWLWRR